MRPNLPMKPIVILALAALAGCARVVPGAGDDRARLVFMNESLEQAAVYVSVGGAEPQRIGTVLPGTTDTLALSNAYVGRGNVVISARLLARRATPTSGAVPIHRGDVLHVRLPSDGRTLVVLPGTEP